MFGSTMRSVVVGAIGVCSMALSACASDDQRPTLQPAPSTPPSTAAPSPQEVKATIRSGLGSLRSFRAEMVIRYSGQERHKTLEVTAEGTVRETDFGPGRETTSVYDAARGVIYNAGSRFEPVYGQPPGRSPRAGLMGPEPWSVELRPGVIDDPVLFARHVLDWPQFTVALTTENGRPAWGIQWSPPRGGNPDHVSVTIDRSTGLALRAEAFFENGVVYVLEVAALEVNTELSIPPPPQASGGRGTDLGYRRTTVQEAGALAGYQPVTPTWLPAGFVAAEVGYVVQYRSSTAFLHPDSTDIVSAVYRRGLDVLTITTRRRGSRPWTNPIGGATPPPPPEAPPSSEQPAPRIELVEWGPAVISGGAFRGAHAERTSRAWYGQSLLWALNDQLSLTVLGDVTVDEMQRIVESLRPV